MLLVPVLWTIVLLTNIIGSSTVWVTLVVDYFEFSDYYTNESNTLWLSNDATISMFTGRIHFRLITDSDASKPG